MSDLSASPEAQLSSTPNHVRHFQWNDDYIELLAHRLELAAVRTLIEVGSGLGHLAGLFGLYMKPGSVVRGFDPDPAVVEAAAAQAAERAFSVRYAFEQAELERLPLADGVADLVISHHVLADVPDPRAVLAEMVRVVRPGGRVVAFEPNNMVQTLVLDSDTSSYPVEERLRLVRYQLWYEAGKRSLGRGDDSIGDRLPALFLEAGLGQVEVRISDKAGALVPPYDTEEKRARVAELLAWRDEFAQAAPWIRECFLAGGGTPDDWEAYRELELAQAERMRAAIAAGTYSHPGGMLTYIVGGVKA